MEFVDISSLHQHVCTLLPRHEHPVQTLAMLIALTGCDFCNSMPVIGPSKLWAARPFQDATSAGVALSLNSPDGDNGFPGAMAVGDELSVFCDVLATGTTSLTITAEANQDGTLFEAVKPAAIAKELGATPDEIPWITITKPIKSTGKHTVQLVHGKEKASGTIEVVAATK
jgi:hypothetical protein